MPLAAANPTANATSAPVTAGKTEKVTRLGFPFAAKADAGAS